MKPTISQTKSLANVLKQQYDEQYKNCFDVESPQNVSSDSESILNIMLEKLDTIVVLRTLLRAITWYLYFHDNTDSSGNSYPYGFQYLFSKKNDNWLLRTCI